MGRGMRVLHLFSNYKWTGPAEPAVNLVCALRDLGVDVAFACGRPPLGVDCDVAINAVARGLDPIRLLALPKHFRPVALWRDARELSRILERERFDIVHAHQRADHLVAGWAARRVGGIPIVRTVYDGDPPPRGMRNTLVFSRFTDAALVVSRRVRERLGTDYSLGPERLFPCETSIDLERFNPERPLEDMRARWGIAPDEPCAGIVARIQSRRRWDAVLDAMDACRRAKAGVRLVVIGRGTAENELLVRPIAERGLGNVVLHAGYLRGDEYVAALHALDAKLFLVPGSDGSCRAVREAMAMGVPVLASRRGALPEIVNNGVTGWLIDDSPAGIARALSRVASDRELAARLGENARKEALSRFDASACARDALDVYERLVDGAG